MLEHEGSKARRHKGTERDHPPVPERVERLATAVVDAAFRVHTALGPGLLESVYEACMCHELSRRKIPFRRQVAVPIVYDDIRLESGVRLDLLVDDELVVEIKAVEEMPPVYRAQTLTYVRLLDLRLGLLINFDVRTHQGRHPSRD